MLVGGGGGRRLPLVAIDLGLAFPVSLIESSHQLLERLQAGWFTDASNLVLKAVWKTLILLARKRYVVPTTAVRVMVEIDGVAGCLTRVFIAQGFQELGSIGNRVPGAKKSTEFCDKGGVVIHPIRHVIALFQRSGHITLEPVQWITLKVGEREGNMQLIVREVVMTCGEIHQALKHKCLYLQVGGIGDGANGPMCEENAQWPEGYN
jgi:hypothetical protein